MSTVWAVLRVGPLIQAVGDDLVQDLLERIERTAVTTAPVLLELKCQLQSQARFVPPGFLPLALAGSLFVAAAGVHECIRQRGRGGVPRHRTHLRRAPVTPPAEPRAALFAPAR